MHTPAPQKQQVHPEKVVAVAVDPPAHNFQPETPME
jgi:hypothetical protein